MTTLITIAVAAKDDLFNAAARYDLQSPGLGDAFIAQVDAVFEQLRHHPETYQIAFAPVRKAVLRRFPFAILYHIRPASIEVLGVLPCRANPDILQQRATGARDS